MNIHIVTSRIKRNRLADLEDLSKCLVTLGDDLVHFHWRTIIQNAHVDRLFLLISILPVVSFFVDTQSIKYSAFVLRFLQLHLTNLFQFISLSYVNILTNCILSFHFKLSIFNKLSLEISVIEYFKVLQAIIAVLIFVKPLQFIIRLNDLAILFGHQSLNVVIIFLIGLELELLI